MTLLAFIAGSVPGIDAAKCVRLALVHDVAESIVGDLTPYCGVDKSEKHTREAAAMARLQDMLGTGAWALVGAQMKTLWDEYESTSLPPLLSSIH